MEIRKWGIIVKITTGTDIIEIDRIKKSVEETENKFLNRVFTESEIEYCESKNVQKYQHYAARFAAKEAVFKAVSYKLKDKYEISWKNVEVIPDKQGRPQVYFVDFNLEGLQSIDISLSHCKQYAVANVICVCD